MADAEKSVGDGITDRRVTEGGRHFAFAGVGNMPRKKDVSLENESKSKRSKKKWVPSDGNKKDHTLITVKFKKVKKQKTVPSCVDCPENKMISSDLSAAKDAKACLKFKRKKAQNTLGGSSPDGVDGVQVVLDRTADDSLGMEGTEKVFVDKLFYFETRPCHVVEENGEKLFKCDVCGTSYRYAFSLKRHFLRNHVNYKYLSEADISNCMINIAKSAVKHENHMKVEKTNSLDVSSEGNDFPAVGGGSCTTTTSSSSFSCMPNLYQCNMCFEFFDVLKELIQHTKDHPYVAPSKAFTCTLCHMKFSYKKNLLRHQAVHSGEKLFQCGYCAKKFSTEISKKQHQRIHAVKMQTKEVLASKKKVLSVKQDGPSMCEICGKTFSTSAYLSKHLVCMHNGVLRERKRFFNKCNKQKEKSEVSRAPVEKSKTVKSEIMKQDTRKTKKRNSKFRHKCTICKRRFKFYIHLCKHHRFVHPSDSELNLKVDGQVTSNEETKSMKQNFREINDFDASLDYCDMASNIAKNLGSYIDGNQESLAKFSDYLKIKGYKSMFTFEEQENCSTICWTEYNFSPSFELILSQNSSNEVEINKVIENPNASDCLCKTYAGVEVDVGRNSSEENLPVTGIKKEPMSPGIIHMQPVVDCAKSTDWQQVLSHQLPAAATSLLCEKSLSVAKPLDLKEQPTNVPDVNSLCSGEKLDVEQNTRNTCQSETAHFDCQQSLRLKPVLEYGCEEVLLKGNTEPIGTSTMGGDSEVDCICPTLSPINSEVNFEINPAPPKLSPIHFDLKPLNHFCSDFIAKPVSPTPGAAFNHDEIKYINIAEPSDAAQNDVNNIHPLQPPINTLLGSENKLHLHNVELNNLAGISMNPLHNFQTLMFGKRGDISYVCSVCKKHFADMDKIWQHQLQKHPNIECSFLEVEEGYGIDQLHYHIPSPEGLLAKPNLFPEDLHKLEMFSCSKCANTFPTLTRLHSHIIRCASGQSDKKLGIKNIIVKKRKYRKRLKKKLRDALNGTGQFKFRLRDFAGYDPSLFHSKKKAKWRKYKGCQKRKVLTMSDTSLLKLKKKRNYELPYNPKNHVRRREFMELVETHQCRGCNSKFKTISLLERHVPSCAGKDKLRSLQLFESIKKYQEPKKHECTYCHKRFTYPKSLVNHCNEFCSVRAQQLCLGNLAADNTAKDEAVTHLVKEEERLVSSSSDHLPEIYSQLDYQKGLQKRAKRKFRRKNSCWAYIKKKVSAATSRKKKLMSLYFNRNSDCFHYHKNIKSELVKTSPSSAENSDDIKEQKNINPVATETHYSSDGIINQENSKSLTVETTINSACKTRGLNDEKKVVANNLKPENNSNCNKNFCTFCDQDNGKIKMFNAQSNFSHRMHLPIACNENSAEFKIFETVGSSVCLVPAPDYTHNYAFTLEKLLQSKKTGAEDDANCVSKIRESALCGMTRPVVCGQNAVPACDLEIEIVSLMDDVILDGLAADHKSISGIESKDQFLLLTSDRSSAFEKSELQEGKISSDSCKELSGSEMEIAVTSMNRGLPKSDGYDEPSSQSFGFSDSENMNKITTEGNKTLHNTEETKVGTLNKLLDELKSMNSSIETNKGVMKDSLLTLKNTLPNSLLM